MLRPFFLGVPVCVRAGLSVCVCVCVCEGVSVFVYVSCVGGCLGVFLFVGLIGLLVGCSICWFPGRSND